MVDQGAGSVSENSVARIRHLLRATPTARRNAAVQEPTKGTLDENPNPERPIEVTDGVEQQTRCASLSIRNVTRGKARSQASPYQSEGSRAPKRGERPAYFSQRRTLRTREGSLF